MDKNIKFKFFIQDILFNYADLNYEHIKELTDFTGMKEFTSAFTTPTSDSINNNSFSRILGDVTISHTIVWILYHKYPDKFLTTSGIYGSSALLTQLKINGINKETLAKYANDLQFKTFINVSELEKLKIDNNPSDEIYSNTFEAFIGTLEYLIDLKIENNTGYSIVYNLMKKLIDKTDINIDIDLYDSKSRVNNEQINFKSYFKIIYETNPTEFPEYDINTLTQSEKEELRNKRFNSRIIVKSVTNFPGSNSENYKYNSIIYQGNLFYGSSIVDVEKKCAKDLLDSDFLINIHI